MFRVVESRLQNSWSCQGYDWAVPYSDCWSHLFYNLSQRRIDNSFSLRRNTYIDWCFRSHDTKRSREMKRIVIMLFAATMLMLTSGTSAPNATSLPLPLVASERCQCHSVTKSGNRCKRKAVPQKLYCRQHSSATLLEGDSGPCFFVSESGARCESTRMAGRRYCKVHQEMNIEKKQD